MEYIKIEKKDRGYFDPKTGKKLLSIKGRRNRKGIDGFEHSGTDYPAYDYSQMKMVKRKETKTNIVYEIKATEREVDTVVLNDSVFNAKRLDPGEIVEALNEWYPPILEYLT